MKNFRKTQEWKREGTNFTVTVNQWDMATLEYVPGSGYINGPMKNCWNVYAYVYPNHPWFKRILKGKEKAVEALELYFHKGVTLFRTHREDGNKITSIQFGSDYQHSWDSETRSADLETNKDILADANTLFDQLEGAK